MRILKPPLSQMMVGVGSFRVPSNSGVKVLIRDNKPACPNSWSPGSNLGITDKIWANQRSSTSPSGFGSFRETPRKCTRSEVSSRPDVLVSFRSQIGFETSFRHRLELSPNGKVNGTSDELGCASFSGAHATHSLSTAASGAVRDDNLCKSMD